MADYKQTMFIIEFTNGKQKKWDDDKFKLEISEDRSSLKVFSRITKEVALDVPNLENVLYIHQGIIKRAKQRPFNGVPLTAEEFESAVEEPIYDPDDM